MPSGTPIVRGQFIHVLRLLRQSRRPDSGVKRSQIPHITSLHRHTVTAIIEQAAIKWLESIEDAERHDDLVDRGR